MNDFICLIVGIGIYTSLAGYIIESYIEGRKKYINNIGKAILIFMIISFSTFVILLLGTAFTVDIPLFSVKYNTLDVKEWQITSIEELTDFMSIERYNIIYSTDIKDENIASYDLESLEVKTIIVETKNEAYYIFDREYFSRKTEYYSYR